MWTHQSLFNHPPVCCLHYFETYIQVVRNVFQLQIQVVTLCIYNFVWWEVYLQDKFLEVGLLGQSAAGLDITVFPFQQCTTVPASPQTYQWKAHSSLLFANLTDWR